jgi:hypothetical protein
MYSMNAPCQHQQLCEHRFEPTVTFDLAGNVANDAAEMVADELRRQTDTFLELDDLKGSISRTLEPIKKEDDKKGRSRG